jgi:Bacteriophage head to tail connecting protein
MAAYATARTQIPKANGVVPYDRKREMRKAKNQPDVDPFYTRGGPTLLSQTEADPRADSNRPTQREQQEWAVWHQHCESRRSALYNWRLPHWTTWQEIARFERPERSYAFIVPNVYEQGRRKDQRIVDRTATLCGEVCAAGLMAALTDPDRDWCVLGPGIPGLELDQAGQQWYEDLSERYNYVLTHSNFYDAQAQHYDDLVFFGTAPIIDYPDEKEIIHCFTPCAGEFMLGAGFDFSDEVLERDFRLTVSQMVEMFGLANCPPDIQQMWRNKGGALEYESVISHLIEPNFPIHSDSGDVGVIPGGFTWREVYWVQGKKDARPLEKTGFFEQPFAVSRWNTQANDPYGRGVGEYMLGDTIGLQLATRQQATAIQKVLDPPMGADVSLQNLPTSTNPGKITYFNTGNGAMKKFEPLYEIKPDIPAITAYIASLQERIARTAYNDIFRMMENLRNETKGEVTATEIDALKEEALMRMGPVIGRIYGSLRTRVKRHLTIMARRGLIPPKPASLRGVPLKIEFISMLTAAQKATSTQAIARLAQYVGSVSGVWPEAKFVFNAQDSVREFGAGVGATTKVINSPSQTKKLMAAAAQQAQAAAALQQTVAGSAAAGNLAKTSLAPGNALSALVGGGAPQ